MIASQHRYQRSAAWEAFERTASGDTKCLLCNNILSGSQNTSNMWSHLKWRHPISYQELWNRPKMTNVRESEDIVSANQSNSCDFTMLVAVSPGDERSPADRAPDDNASNENTPVTTDDLMQYFSPPECGSRVESVCKSETNTPVDIIQITQAQTPPDETAVDEKVATRTTKRSPVWAAYKRHSNNKLKCLWCSFLLGYAGNTTNMWNHLKLRHNSKYVELFGKEKITVLWPAKIASTSRTSGDGTPDDDPVRPGRPRKAPIEDDPNRKSGKTKSFVWQAFERISDGYHKCLTCGFTIKSNLNTTNMWNHLRNKHRSKFDELKLMQLSDGTISTTKTESVQVQPKLTSCRLCSTASDELRTNQIIMCFGEWTSVGDDVATVLNLHFPFDQLQPDRDASVFVCRPCWLKVHTFHQFYQSVVTGHQRTTVKLELADANAGPQQMDEDDADGNEAAADDDEMSATGTFDSAAESPIELPPLDIKLEQSFGDGDDPLAEEQQQEAAIGVAGHSLAEATSQVEPAANHSEAEAAPSSQDASCPICSRSFTSTGHLCLHIIRCHPAESVSAEPAMPPLQCDECGQWQRNVAAHQRHMATHQAPSVADGQRATPAAASVSADYRLKRLQALATLARHQQRMPGEGGAYRCECCSLVFRSKALRSWHRQRKHGALIRTDGVVTVSADQ